MLKKIASVVLAVLLPASLLFGAVTLNQVLGTQQVKDAILTTINGNTTTISGVLNGTSSGVTLNAPTIADHTNAQHDHSLPSKGGSLSSVTITNPIFAGTFNGTYTLGGAPTITTEAWTVLTGVCGANYNCTTGYYMKDPLGFVHLKGYVTSTNTSPGTAFTLPSGYRPAAAVTLSVYNSTNGGSGMTVTTGGVATPFPVTNGTATYLDGLTLQ
jgi:hypothetical protein